MLLNCINEGITKVSQKRSVLRSFFPYIHFCMHQQIGRHEYLFLLQGKVFHLPMSQDRVIEGSSYFISGSSS